MTIYLMDSINLINSLLYKDKCSPQKEHFLIAYANPLEILNGIAKTEIIDIIETERYGVKSSMEAIRIPKRLALVAIKSAIKLDKCLIFIHSHVDFDVLNIEKKEYWSRCVKFSDADIMYIKSILKVYEKILNGKKELPIFFIVINRYTYQSIAAWMDSSFHMVEIEGVILKNNLLKDKF